MIKISVIVPTYNEEKNIKTFVDRIIPTIKKITEDYEIIFALDPSKDKTEELILEEISSPKALNLMRC